MSSEIRTQVAIIGGGFSGLSAALILGRGKMATRLFSSGLPRNSPSHEAHSYLTRDGENPAELWSKAKADVAMYPSIEAVNRRIVKVESVATSPIAFRLTDEAGDVTIARRVILATGGTDVLPDIAGLAPLVGTKVHFCPFCNGFEYGERHLAVIGVNEMSFHLANMIAHWTPNVTLFINPDLLQSFKALPDPKNRLSSNVKIQSLPTSVAHRPATDDVLLSTPDGDIVAAGVFITPKIENRIELAKMVGADISAEGFVEVDANLVSSVPGFAAVGDIAVPRGQKMPYMTIAQSVGSGLRAGMVFCGQLIMEDLA